MSDQNAKVDLIASLSSVNSLEVIMNLSTTFACKICHQFMIDICTLPCGHRFCKFCSLSWLRLESTCPICRKQVVKPCCTRCYEMESVVEDLYPLIYQFYSSLERTKNGHAFIARERNGAHCGNQLMTSENLSNSDHFPNLQSLRKQINPDDTSDATSHWKAIHICSPAEREIIRQKRRSISERNDILLEAPCLSILQKLITLGWGTSSTDQSISAVMRYTVWSLLCYVFWNFLYVFRHSCFEGGPRIIIYACLIFLAVNFLQMQLFRNPGQSHNLLDFEFLEYQDPISSESNDNRSSNAHATTATSTQMAMSNQATATSGSANNGDTRESYKVSSSNEIFKDCDHEEGESSSDFELEQILMWSKEGKLDFDAMLKMADAIMQVI